MAVFVYNIKTEDHSSNKNNFLICRPYILGNPFTYDGKRSNLAKLSFKTREEAINAYEIYFNEMMKTNKDFQNAFNEIYEKYKNGEDIYLGCFCYPNKCHGEIIAKELQRKLILEKKKERTTI